MSRRQDSYFSLSASGMCSYGLHGQLWSGSGSSDQMLDFLPFPGVSDVDPAVAGLAIVLADSNIRNIVSADGLG